MTRPLAVGLVLAGVVVVSLVVNLNNGGGLRNGGLADHEPEVVLREGATWGGLKHRNILALPPEDLQRFMWAKEKQ